MISTEDLIWSISGQTVFCSREEYFAMLEGWTVERFAHFVRVSKGPEFHFVALPGSTASKQDIRDCVQPIIDAHGYATTKTPHGDTRQHRFNRLIGFVQTGQDELDVHYRIERIRHV